MSDPAQTVSVDDHRFRITRRAGAYDFAWLTGPRGYGFTVAYNGMGPMNPADIEDVVRSFLVQVNPESGFID